MKPQINILIMNVIFLKVSFSHYSYLILHLSINIDEQKRYTFKSFQEEVDNLAASLLQLGFEKNDRIAVWLPNMSESATMSFAASKLGLIKVNPYICISFQLQLYLLFSLGKH